MLVDPDIAISFLANYKALMKHLNNGVEPENVQEYAEIRPALYRKLQEDTVNFEAVVGKEFVHALESASFGQYVYLKRYRAGYALFNLDDQSYYQVAGLTSPIEEFTEDFSLIETCVVPYQGQLICDGLIVNKGISLGGNYTKEIRDGYWRAKKAGELRLDA